MTRRTRRLLKGAFVGTILLAGAVFANGYIIEQFVQRALHQVNLLGGVELSLLSYKRGVWSSEALMKVTITEPVLNKILTPDHVYVEGDTHYPSISFTLKQEILHGPYIFPPFVENPVRALALIRAHLAQEKEQLVLRGITLDEGDYFDVEAILAYDGDLSLKVQVSPFEIDNQSDPQKYILDGLKGNWQIYQMYNHIEETITLPRLEYQGDNFQWVAHDLGLNRVYHLTSSGFWAGNVKLSVKDIVLYETKTMPTQQISGIMLNLETEEEAQKIAMTGQAAFQSWHLARSVLGPAEFSYSLTGLDLGMLRKGFDKIFSPGPDDSVGSWLTIAGRALESPVVFGIPNLHIKTESGFINGELKGAWGNPKLATVKLEEWTDPNLMNSLKLDVSLQFPKEAVKEWVGAYEQQVVRSDAIRKGLSVVDDTVNIEQKSQARIAEWVKKDFLEDHKALYVLKISIADGRFLMNNTPQSLIGVISDLFYPPEPIPTEGPVRAP